MKDFRSVKAWEKAHTIAVAVYRVTAPFPKEERYGLTSQMRRAASSVPMNIAEGCGAGTDAEFGRFLQIAMRSACELEYQLLLARDLGYLSPEIQDELTKMVTEVKRMLTGFIQRLKSHPPGSAES